jgi:hypothetical protein
MFETKGLLAIHRMDFFTATRILTSKKIIDGIYSIGMAEPSGRVLLVHGMPSAIRLKSKHETPSVFIVCMDCITAGIYGIDVIDSGNENFPVIDFSKITTMIKRASGANPQLLHIPIVNVDRVIIDQEVNRLQTTQILSHFNTAVYALPKPMREDIKVSFLKWLEGKISTGEFCAHVRYGKATGALISLVNFMKSDYGKNYPRVFCKLFKGEGIEHDLPVFEVNYFAILKARLIGKK